MTQTTDGDGRPKPMIGNVVTLVMEREGTDEPKTGRIGVVIDAWPLHEPDSIRVRWEPLLLGEVSTLRLAEVAVVPLADRGVSL